MTVHLFPAVIAVLVGLVASGAVDATTDAGNTHAVVWTAFALSLALVARDALFGGSFFPRDDDFGRLPLRVGQGDIQVRFWQFEPIATTLAILLGLLAEQAIDMRANGNSPDGSVTSAMWAVFALSLVLALGGRMGRRPRPRRRRRKRSQRWDEVGEEIEARVEEILEDIEQRFGGSGRPRSSDS